MRSCPGYSRQDDILQPRSHAELDSASPTSNNLIQIIKNVYYKYFSRFRTLQGAIPKSTHFI